MNKLIDKQFIQHILKIITLLIVSTALVLWAWNNAMTTIFGLPAIQFKEATGIIILAVGISFLFKPGGYHVRKCNEE